MSEPLMRQITMKQMVSGANAPLNSKDAGWGGHSIYVVRVNSIETQLYIYNDWTIILMSFTRMALLISGIYVWDQTIHNVEISVISIC